MMDLHISVKLPNVDPTFVAQEFNNFRRQREEDAKQIMLDTLHEEILRRNLRAEGDLETSWETSIEAVGDTRKIVATTEDIAAPALEYGTSEASSGIVNVGKILDWANAKPVQPTYGTIEQFAWAVAKKIGKEGLPLHGGLKRPFNAAQKKANRKIEKMYEQEIELLVRRLNQ